MWKPTVYCTQVPRCGWGGIPAKGDGLLPRQVSSLGGAGAADTSSSLTGLPLKLLSRSGLGYALEKKQKGQ